MSDSNFVNYTGVGVLAIGILITLFGVYSVWYAHSAAWVETSGIVSSVRVRASVHTVDDAIQRDAVYYPEIEYQNSVNGKNYESDKYQLRSNHPWSVEREEALRAAVKYRNGDSIPVFYNAKQPAVAVLKPTVQWADYAALLLGLTFLFTGWLLRRVAVFGSS